MKSRHAAALALVVWYLMRPPLPHLYTYAVHKDTAAALRGWKMGRSFPTQKECEAHRANPWGTVRRQRRPAPEGEIGGSLL